MTNWRPGSPASAIQNTPNRCKAPDLRQERDLARKNTDQRKSQCLQELLHFNFTPKNSARRNSQLLQEKAP